ncbi:MAG TPA: hypothetical protein VMJ10_32530 [Kofleriaceae bacterium]|nr:hypothetical protein [Kofleriaceae bacterium]
MGRTGLIAATLSVAACRFDFDPELLSGQASRFQLGAADVTSLVPVATPTGFALVTSRAGGAVTGSTFDLGDAGLVVSKQNVSLATSPTGSIGVASNGSEVMLAALDGSPATGTSLYPLGAALAATAGGTSRTGQLAITNPIASGAGGFAFASMLPTTLEVDAQQVSPLGAAGGSAVQIIAGTEQPEEVSIVSAGAGFAVSYTEAAGSPKAARIEVLDASFTVIAGPVTGNITADDAFHVRIAWSPQSATYLLAWSAKDETAADDVWVEIFDSTLAQLVPPTLLARYADNPEVAADGAGYWVVWEDTSTSPTFLTSAHVDLDGTPTPRTITTDGGGEPALWSVLDRAGQAVVVWTEIGGTGPDLFIQ